MQKILYLIDTNIIVFISGWVVAIIIGMTVILFLYIFAEKIVPKLVLIKKTAREIMRRRILLFR